MIRPWKERKEAMEQGRGVDPVWRSLTLGQFLEGCAQAASSPYPLWLLRKYCGRYRTRTGHITPEVPMYLMLCGRSPETCEECWAIYYQLLVETFHLIYMNQSKKSA